jgi:pimeloyl-ACP methyl ester carboxylesterase
VTSVGMLDHIAQGLPMEERELALAVQGQSFAPMFDEKLTVCAWKTKPCWFVISTNDHMLPPAMEESAAQALGASATTLATCHMAMLEQPSQVAAVIGDAAKKSLGSSKKDMFSEVA